MNRRISDFNYPFGNQCLFFPPDDKNKDFFSFHRDKNFIVPDLTITVGGVYQRSYTALTIYKLTNLTNEKVYSLRNINKFAFFFRQFIFPWKFPVHYMR